MSKPTCGPLFLRAVERWAGSDPARVLLFSAGHVHGQAEKVYLGACRGAMFRPSPEFRGQLLEVVESAAELYGLYMSTLGAEIWLLRDAASVALLDEIREYPENSRSWHAARGALCGVPAREIDAEFHLRRGFGERCEPKGE